MLNGPRFWSCYATQATDLWMADHVLHAARCGCCWCSKLTARDTGHTVVDGGVRALAGIMGLDGP